LLLELILRVDAAVDCPGYRVGRLLAGLFLRAAGKEAANCAENSDDSLLVMGGGDWFAGNAEDDGSAGHALARAKVRSAAGGDPDEQPRSLVERETRAISDGCSQPADRQMVCQDAATFLFALDAF
jgi:hypothetical protein